MKKLFLITTLLVTSVCSGILAMQEKAPSSTITIKEENVESSGIIRYGLVAYDQDKNTLGCLTYNEIVEDEPCSITFLHVAAHMRRNGIGSSLISQFIEHAKNKRCSEIQVFSAPNATAFYEKFGLTCKKPSPDDDDNSPYNNVRLCYLSLKEK